MASLLLLALYAVGVVVVALSARFVGRPIELRWLAVLAALPLLFLSPGFFADKTPLPLKDSRNLVPWFSVPLAGGDENPRSIDLQDLALQIVPWTKAGRMAWKEGSLPLRNRWNGCGMPLAANSQSAPFSPFFLASLPVPLARAFTLIGAWKLLLALAGMWLWLSGLGVGPAARLLGSVAFAFSFPMTAWLFYPLTAVLCLWPAALFLLDRLCERAAARRAFALLVVVLTAWALGGHPETALLGVIFGAIWVAARWRSLDRGAVRRVILGGAAAGILAAGLSMFLLVPEALAIRASNRRSENATLNRAMPWGPRPFIVRFSYVTLLFPRAFGDEIDFPMLKGCENSFAEMGAGYFGIVAWALALTAVRRGSLGSAPSRALASIAVLSIGLGTRMWPFRLLVSHTPILHLMFPLRYRTWIALAGPAIAALQLDRLSRSEGDRRAGSRFVALSAALLSLLAWLAFRRFEPLYSAPGALASEERALAVTLLVLGAVFAASLVTALSRGAGEGAANRFALVCAVVCAAELGYQANRFYSYGSPARLYPETPLTKFLKSRGGTFRVAGEGAAMFPSTNVFVPAEDIRTHDPIEEQRYASFLEANCGVSGSEYYKFLTDVNCRALDFLNVRYLVSGPGRAAPGDRWQIVYSGGDGTVFENRRVLPRIFAPAEISSVSAPGESSGPPEFAKRAVLSSEGRESLDRLRTESNPPVVFDDYRETTNEVSVRYALAGGSPSVAVASLVNDGGWRAEVEGGRSVPTLDADGPFLGLIVPPGRHVLRLRYRPPGFRFGAAVSAATALLLAAAFAVVTRGRPRRS